MIAFGFDGPHMTAKGMSLRHWYAAEFIKAQIIAGEVPDATKAVKTADDLILELAK